MLAGPHFQQLRERLGGFYNLFCKNPPTAPPNGYFGRWEGYLQKFFANNPHRVE